MKLKKSSRRVAGVFGAGIVAAACALPATLIAQDYPSRSITIVVPFPAGAAVDNLIRPLTHEVGLLRCEANVVHLGTRTATSEGRITDHQGKLYAHGTTTCIVVEAPLGPLEP